MRLIMRSIAVAALLLCAQAASAETFEDFVRHFGRTYASKEAEEIARHNFEKTAARVKELQAANPLARFSALTPVADRDFSTKRRPRSPHHDRLHQLRRDSVQAALAEQTNTPVPTLVDWREKGAVSPVGNMGQCSDSAGFVIDDVAEGALFIANGGTLVQLAHRQMRECYTHCDGAWAKDVVDKIVARGGALYTNASFVNDDCDGSQGSQIGCILTSYVPIPPTSGALARAVAYQGPIGVAIYAMDWMTYIGGVMTNCGNSTHTDPADDYATVVGYNDEVAPPYWIIKNSWGVEWGENGYIYVARHSDQCVIHTAPFLLTVQNPGH